MSSRVIAAVQPLDGEGKRGVVPAGVPSAFADRAMIEMHRRWIESSPDGMVAYNNVVEAAAKEGKNLRLRDQMSVGELAELNAALYSEIRKMRRREED